MKIILFGLEQTLPAPAEFRLHRCTDIENLAQMLLGMTPEFVVVEEGKADLVLSALGDLTGELQTEVIILCAITAVTTTREWVAKGARHVWPALRWEDKLSELSQSVHSSDQIDQNVSPGDSASYERSQEMTQVIAVGGTYSGAGSTLMSLLVANFMARRYRTKVAVIECGNKPSFSQLDMFLNGHVGAVLRPRLEVGDLVLFKADSNNSYAYYAADDYPIVVMDMGDVDQSEDKEEFFKANLSILVASPNDWRMPELMNFCQRNSSYRQDRMRVALPMAEQESLDLVRGVLRDRLVFSVPQHVDPFDRNPETDECLEGILSPMLPKRVKTGFARLLGKK